MMKDDDFKLLSGFADKCTDGQTDICDCRVAFATENCRKSDNCIIYLTHQLPTERAKNKRMKMGKFQTPPPLTKSENFGLFSSVL